MTAGKQTNYEWIAFEQLPKPASQTAGLLDLFISQAYAGEAPNASQPMVVAQAETQVVCQTKTKDMVTRIVKDGAKCFKGNLFRCSRVRSRSARKRLALRNVSNRP